VEQQDDFVIPFRGLGTGIHRFHYAIDGSFFEELEYSEIQEGNLTVDLTMDRQERMLLLDFLIQGTVDVPCDRCLEDFSLEVDDHPRLIVKFGDAYEEEDDDIIVIPHEEHQIDVRQHIYEYILLSLPLRRVHPDDELGQSTCDPDMLSALERLQVHPPADGRWDALSGLRDEAEEEE